MSDNEIYLLIKYIKSVLWRVTKRLSYIEEARCLKVKHYAIVIMMKSAHDSVPANSISYNLEYSYTKRGESDDFGMPSLCVAMLQTGDRGGEKHLLLTETPFVI